MDLRRLIETPRFESDEENRAALILHVVLSGAAVIALVLGVVVSYLSAEWATVAVTYGIVLAAVSTSWVVLHKRKVRLAAVLLCSALWLICLHLVWRNGGASSPFVHIFIPIVVVAAATWSQRAAMVLTALTAVAVLGMVWAQAAALLPASAALEPVRVWASLTGSLVMTCTLMVLGLRSIGSALHEARQSETQLAEVIEEAPDGLVMLSPTGRILSYNRAAEVISGYSAQEIVGHRFTEIDLMPTAQAKHFAGVFADLISGQPGSTRELEIRHKNGEMVPIEANTALLRRGSSLALQVTIRDISERRNSARKNFELEEQLRQAQKMEAIGLLAGGVAHDFNNLITAINGYSELALAGLASDDPIRSDLEEIRSAGDRAASLTRQLLAFSRRQILEPEVVELNDAVRGIGKLLARVIGEDVGLTTRLSPEAGRVLIDPGQLEQVIVNLAVNARDAMPAGGRLTVTTADLQLDHERRVGGAVMPPGRYVLLGVADTGKGMDDEVLAHLFEPFFTTKDKSAGTGLGLATVYGIVKQSGGYIAIESQIDRGSEFTIYLPRIEQALTPKSTPKALRPREGSEVILLVEDEASVREVVQRTLERAGYQVLTAPDAESAQTVVASFAGQIQLLLTDVVLPGVRGDELAGSLMASSSVRHVLFMSGYFEEAIGRHGIRRQGDLLHKPFSAEQLLRRVRDAMASSS